MTSSDSAVVHGIDSERTGAWLVEHVPGAVGPFRFSAVVGGESNLTYLVTGDNAETYVLRRPPSGELQATAHDVFREAHILSSLEGTAVPVPRVLATCDDETVTGSRFYVMDYVRGHVLRTESDMHVFPTSHRAAVCRNLIDTLAAIHAVDVDAVGLGTLGRREGYIRRQLGRWRRQIEASSAPGRDALVQIHEMLVDSAPDDTSSGALIHGDFRFDNAILGEGGAVLAVLDWELSTLGDPLADLAITLAAWSGPGEEMGFGQTGPTSADGCLSLDDAVSHYCATTGRPTADVSWYLAWASWRIACILAGVYDRRKSGAHGSAGGYSLDVYAAEMDRRATLARARLA